ncbi:MAG: hypothetical protein ACUVV6_09495, partial [Thermoplasmatota archaeon]
LWDITGAALYPSPGRDMGMARELQEFNTLHWITDYMPTFSDALVCVGMNLITAVALAVLVMLRRKRKRSER